MKSQQEQLTSRGYLCKGTESKYWGLAFDEKAKLLQRAIPTDRTLGARLLFDSKNNRAIELLIRALVIEKKLYTKIEICHTLVASGQPAIKPLIKVLGEIGTNQHKCMPDKGFKKDNYTLPRDIAVRTLAQMGELTLPDLIEILETGNRKQQSESIDAIGYICFYKNSPLTYANLKDCYLKNSKNDLIKWKVIRAMSGFSESSDFLKSENKDLKNKKLQREIKRSLSLIQKRI